MVARDPSHSPRTIRRFLAACLALKVPASATVFKAEIVVWRETRPSGGTSVGGSRAPLAVQHGPAVPALVPLIKSP